MTAGSSDLYFQCPNPGAPGNKCGNKNRVSNGYTGNKGFAGNDFNTISFCDPFFDKDISLAADTATYMKVAVTKRAPVRNNIDAPKAKGMRLFPR